MTDRELLYDACYVYEALAGLGGMTDRHREAYKKLRARLEQPYPDNFIDAIRYNTAMQEFEPEPVAYINVEERKLEWATPIKWETPTVVKMDKVPLYTAPPQREWVSLTAEELAEISEFHFHGAFSGREIYEDIENKLKEKNT